MYNYVLIHTCIVPAYVFVCVCFSARTCAYIYMRTPICVYVIVLICYDYASVAVPVPVCVSDLRKGRFHKARLISLHFIDQKTSAFIS